MMEAGQGSAAAGWQDLAPLLDDFEALVNWVVRIGPGCAFPSDITGKIDALDWLLQLLRQRHQHLQNGVSLKELLRTRIGVGASVDVRPSGGEYVPPRPRSQVLYQPFILTFLLLYDGRHREVNVAVGELLKHLWPDLALGDFERTRKGVPRCITNAHFAAAELRRRGLLRFGTEERYKTWALSLPGVVAAAKLLATCEPWKMDEDSTRARDLDVQRRLHRRIVETLSSQTSIGDMWSDLVQVVGPWDARKHFQLEQAAEKTYQLALPSNHPRPPGPPGPFTPAQGSPLSLSERLDQLVRVIGEYTESLEKERVHPAARLFYEQLADYTARSPAMRAARAAWGVPEPEPDRQERMPFRI